MFSIVSLAIFNAKYEFILLDICGAERQWSLLKQVIQGQYRKRINQISHSHPPGLLSYSLSIMFFYTFVADEAFEMKPHMQWPYQRKKNLDNYYYIMTIVYKTSDRKYLWDPSQQEIITSQNRFLNIFFDFRYILLKVNVNEKTFSFNSKPLNHLSMMVTSHNTIIIMKISAKRMC